MGKLSKGVEFGDVIVHSSVVLFELSHGSNVVVGGVQWCEVLLEIRLKVSTAAIARGSGSESIGNLVFGLCRGITFIHKS